MGWEGWVAIAVVFCVLVALVRNVQPQVAMLAGLTAVFPLSLLSDKFPDPATLARGFGNEALVTVAILFVVAAALTETGGVALLAGYVLGKPRSVIGAQARMMLPVAGVSAFLNNTPVVAMFLPVVADWCRRHRFPPSKLMIPLSYAAILGGVCTLIGTSTNLVVQGLLRQEGLPTMSFLTITWVGVPVAIVGLLYVLAVSRWLLPERGSARADLADPRQYTVEMTVERGGPIDGRTIEDAGLRHLPGLFLVEIQRAQDRLVAPGPDQVVRADDRLIFAGVVSSVVDLQKMRGLLPATNQVFKLDEPRPDRLLVEAVVSNTSPIVGVSVREGRFRTRYGAVVIAVHRNGERVEQKIGDIVIRPGDTLLVETHPRFLEAHQDSQDFFLVSPIEGSQPRRHHKGALAVAILAAMIGALLLEPLIGITTIQAAFVAAAAMLLTGCLSVDQARRAIEWPVLVTIGAALALGKVLQETGAAEAMAHGIVAVSSGIGTVGVLATVYLATVVLTELVTRTAAAAMIFPVATGVAQRLEVDTMPFAIIVAVAASCGFAAPTGYQTHLMVYGPGGYRFTDYLRLGIAMDLLIMAVAVAATWLVWFR